MKNLIEKICGLIPELTWETKTDKEGMSYRYVLSFYNPRRQAPLVMFIREDYLNGDMIYGSTFWSFWYWFPNIKSLFTKEFPKSKRVRNSMGRH